METCPLCQKLSKVRARDGDMALEFDCEEHKKYLIYRGILQRAATWSVEARFARIEHINNCPDLKRAVLREKLEPVRQIVCEYEEL